MCPKAVLQGRERKTKDNQKERKKKMKWTRLRTEFEMTPSNE